MLCVVMDSKKRVKSATVALLRYDLLNRYIVNMDLTVPYTVSCYNGHAVAEVPAKFREDLLLL